MLTNRLMNCSYQFIEARYLQTSHQVNCALPFIHSHLSGSVIKYSPVDFQAFGRVRTSLRVKPSLFGGGGVYRLPARSWESIIADKSPGELCIAIYTQPSFPNGYKVFTR